MALFDMFATCSQFWCKNLYWRCGDLQGAPLSLENLRAQRKVDRDQSVVLGRDSDRSGRVDRIGSFMLELLCQIGGQRDSCTIGVEA